MNVPSLEFLGLVTAVALLLRLSPSEGWRNVVFLFANLGFILTFSHDLLQLAPFAALLAAGYAAMLWMERSKSAAIFRAVIAFLIAMFCWLKRYAFLPHSMFLPFPYIVVGMSYVFFRLASLVIDAFEGSLPERIGPVTFLNYTLNFTALVAGPIESYRQYRDDEVERPPIDGHAAAGALERIVIGFFKVTVVSPWLSWVHRIFIDAASPSLTVGARAVDGALIMAIFPIFLYANFSGYTDVVIGAARFLNMRLPENFDRPFTAEGFLEFWRRWHMSLSNWFRTYVYSPMLLALMRRFPSRSVEPMLGVLAFFVTFFLVGLWHGQTLMFVVLGMLTGLGASGNKLYQIAMIRWLGRAPYRMLCSNVFYAALSRGLTFTWLAFSLLFLWATWGQLTGMVRALGWEAAAAAIPLTILGMGAILSISTILVDRLSAAVRGGRAARAALLLRPAWFTALGVVTVSVAVMLNAPSPHIVYGGF